MGQAQLERRRQGEVGLETRWALAPLQPTHATRRHEAAGVALLCSMQRLKPTAVASGETGEVSGGAGCSRREVQDGSRRWIRAAATRRAPAGHGREKGSGRKRGKAKEEQGHTATCGASPATGLAG